LPESFLISDELLIVAERLIKNLEIRDEAIKRNLETYAPFSCTERVMMLISKRGGDRQEMHERLREQALVAWQVVQRGETNPLVENLKADPQILKWVSAEEIDQLSNVSGYTGIAKTQAKSLAAHIRLMLN
jgi:adenylosuccinate lyase